MLMLEPIIEATNLKELQTNLSAVAGHCWHAVNCYYLTYDDRRQVLSFANETIIPEPTDQVGLAALNLATCDDQSLTWPACLPHQQKYRQSIPIFVWGSLVGVLCLEFSKAPGELEDFEELERTLGHLTARVLDKEMSTQFMTRCKELLVRGVEAQGKSGHIQRLSRLVASLAKLLDCSPQVKSDLLEAAQYHDIGLLTFETPGSTEAQQGHPQVGASLLNSHTDLFEVARMVSTHHERYDGSGFPNRNSGDELPLECWILALAEDFVEFWETSVSSYEGKIKEFFAGNAKHHHPDVVDALCGLVDSGELESILD